MNTPAAAANMYRKRLTTQSSRRWGHEFELTAQTPSMTLYALHNESNFTDEWHDSDSYWWPVVVVIVVEKPNSDAAADRRSFSSLSKRKYTSVLCSSPSALTELFASSSWPTSAKNVDPAPAPTPAAREFAPDEGGESDPEAERVAATEPDTEGIA